VYRFFMSVILLGTDST